VIDSILAEHEEPQLMMHHLMLKNDLYTLFRYEYDRTVDLFQRYSFPNVGPGKRREFVSELLEMLKTRQALLTPFNFMMLKGVLQIAKTLDSLPFLENADSNVLIDGFSPFFIERICILKHSDHIFDVEPVIQKYLVGIDFCDNDASFSNFRFAASHDEPGIQLSDVMTGLLGKLFSYICTTDLDRIVAIRSALSAQQSRNLRLLSALLKSSATENEVFAHHILSMSDTRKASVFLEL
jgi:hypothetical protein